MRIRGGLVGLLFFLLAGCSFILDPEECQGDGDCANGQSCSSGICLGPVIPLTPEDAGGDVLNADMAAPDQGLPPDEGVDPDRGLPPDAADADVPPARPPICEILEPVGPEVGPISADRITVRGVVGDPDTAVAPPMIATEISAAIRPYSMAVAPDSFLKKRATSFMTSAP